MEKSYIKLYGERNTGTKYMQYLIKLNLDIEIVPGTENSFIWDHWGNGKSPRIYEYACDLDFLLNFNRTLGWKHSFPPNLEKIKKSPYGKKKLIFATITKNPYSWLLSLYDHPYHAHSSFSSFEDFLCSPWQTRGRENAPSQFKNPMDMWNQKNRAYLELSNIGPTYNLRYEDILADPESSIRLLKESEQLNMIHNFFKNRDLSTKANLDKNYEYYRKYYLNEEWKAKLNPQLLQMINMSMDKDLMRHFNYTLLEDI